MTLARFTPSVLDGETLERLFVHRHHLLDDVMGRIDEAAHDTSRRHKLFVGQRGAGKTHLISLVRHRAAQAQSEGLPIALSWLMEDPWEIETYDDLLEQILEQAGEPRPERDAAEQALLALAANRTVIVLVENLDQILAEIGPDGQRRWRALLENERPMLIIATSTRLSEDLLSQAEPFYGFFDTTQLEPFTVEQAADMLTEVARFTDNDSLATLLSTPTGRARLATIAHLAGGQPRVWALLGAGLTDSGIDEMVDMLLARFDDLTPYYQEQLARLSPSERKIVRRIADADRPMTVSELADVARLDQRSASKTVSDLRKRGWVRKHDSILTKNLDARRSYYELAEPLARIAFQMKAARGEPVRLVVDFLSTWFDAEQLHPSGSNTIGDSYRYSALQRNDAVVAMVKALTSGSTTGTDAIRPQADLQALLCTVDDALAEFARDGDPGALLTHPAAITQLLAQRLATETASRLRIELAECAMAVGLATTWVVRAESVVAAAGVEDLPLSLVMLIEAEVATAPESATVRALIAHLADVMDDVDTETLKQTAWLVDRSVMRWRVVDAAAAMLRLLRVFDDRPLPDLERLGLAFDMAVALILVQDVPTGVSHMSSAVDALKTSGSHDLIVWRGRYYLGLIHELVRDDDAARQTFVELLDDVERVTGPEHYIPLIVRRHLIELSIESDGVELIEQMSELLVDMTRVMGRDDPVVAMTRRSLAEMRVRSAHPAASAQESVVPRTIDPGVSADA